MPTRLLDFLAPPVRRGCVGRGSRGWPGAPSRSVPDRCRPRRWRYGRQHERERSDRQPGGAVAGRVGRFLRRRSSQRSRQPVAVDERCVPNGARPWRRSPLGRARWPSFASWSRCSTERPTSSATWNGWDEPACRTPCRLPSDRRTPRKRTPWRAPPGSSAVRWTRCARSRSGATIVGTGLGAPPEYRAARAGVPRRGVWHRGTRVGRPVRRACQPRRLRRRRRAAGQGRRGDGQDRGRPAAALIGAGRWHRRGVACLRCRWDRRSCRERSTR